MQNKCSLPSINFLFMRILTFRYCLFYPDRNAGIQYLLFNNDTLLLKNEFKATRLGMVITHLSRLPQKIQTENTVTS